MERDVAAAAAKLINSKTTHSNRCAPCPHFLCFFLLRIFVRDDGFFDGNALKVTAVSESVSPAHPSCLLDAHSTAPASSEITKLGFGSISRGHSVPKHCTGSSISQCVVASISQRAFCRL